MNEMLCQPCRDYFAVPIDVRAGDKVEYNTLRDNNSVHTNFQEFEKCAQSTCLLCAQVWAQLNSREREHLLFKDPLAHERHSLSTGYRISEDLWVMMFFQGRHLSNFGRELSLLRIEADSAVRSLLSKEERVKKQLGHQEYTSSEGCMLQARNRLIRCLDNHQCTIREASLPPTRLVHIPKAESEGCRLALNSSFPPNVQYLTLSHCWGKGPSLKLTCVQLESFMQQIPFDEIPQTFKDAIGITRWLGYEYLWIDSLCILQDSVEDWRSESGIMANIYCNAVCNIAASDAFDDSEGCHMARDPSIIEPLVVDVSGAKSATPGSLLFKCQISRSFLFDSEFIPKGGSLDKMPLNTRGWVLQERLLSPRILHFTRYGIIWECQCELSWETETINFEETNDRSASTAIRQFRALENGCRDMNALIRTWNSIIERYSQTYLSRPGDILVAISATAKDLLASIPPFDKIGCQYLAGLWSPQLVRQLLWTVDEERPGIKKPSVPVDYRAPSWSWASVDGHIKMRGESDEERKVLVTILDARSIPGGIDPFLQVKGGYITLRGRLWKLNLPNPLPEIYKSVYSFLKHTYIHTSEVQWEIDKDIPGGHHRSALYLLPLEASSMLYEDARDYEIRGLLLAPISQDNSSLKFQRKGTFFAYGLLGMDTVQNDDFEAMMEILELSKWLINDIEHESVLLPFLDEDKNATLRSYTEITIL